MTALEIAQQVAAGEKIEFSIKRPAQESVAQKHREESDDNQELKELG